MRANRTVLQQVGITNNVVNDWKEKGIKISFPMKQHKTYFKSQDGSVFVESADKYVPPLTKEENEMYTKSPETFRRDFLENVKLYYKFHTFLYEQCEYLNQITNIEKQLAAVLALMYLFLSAMDHHYYHFDRYLVYENYPQTPVGYWWNRLENLYEKAYLEKISKTNPPASFLELLSHSHEVLKYMKTKLSLRDYHELLSTLKAIKVFEDTQEKEIRIVSGYPAKEDLLFKSGFGLWNRIWEYVTPLLIRKRYRQQILKLKEGHPITSTRKLLLEPQLRAFQNPVYLEFQKEINRWIS